MSKFSDVVPADVDHLAPEKILALADALRARGIAKIEIEMGTLRLEFFPPTAPIDTTKAATKPEADPDTCRCGHGPHEHNNGLCLRGCEPETCAGPEKPE